MIPRGGGKGGLVSGVPGEIKGGFAHADKRESISRMYVCCFVLLGVAGHRSITAIPGVYLQDHKESVSEVVIRMGRGVGAARGRLKCTIREIIYFYFVICWVLG